MFRNPDRGHGRSHRKVLLQGKSYGAPRIVPTAFLRRSIQASPMHRQHSSALRRGRWSEPGRAYLVTFTTFDRRPCFADWHDAAATARSLASAAAWPHARLLCWVLMPDHWHGLIELGSAENLSRAVGRAKACASREWRHGDQRGQGKLWAPGFHDRAIRSNENLRDAARYVVANPLRAGLVHRIGDYPFWDAIWIES